MRQPYLLLSFFILTVQFALGQSPFYFDGAKVDPGTKQHFTIPVIAEGDTTALPISIFNGIKDGPVLGITAGVHGYEYPPIMAAQQLIRSIRPEKLQGVVILVQVANLKGFQNRAPYINPGDGKNLNRSFPGNPKGTITEKLADYITQQVIAKSDFFLDMHSGDAPEDLMPYAAYYSHTSMPATSDKGHEMAVALNFDHIVVFNTNGKSYMEKGKPSLYCSAEAFKRNIPSIDIECGRLGVADPLLIDKIEDGVLRLLEYLEMMPSDSTMPESESVITITERLYVEARNTGIFYPMKRSGDYVSKGMKLGYVTNYFGEETENVVASGDGIILMMINTPPINVGETIAVIGRVARD